MNTTQITTAVSEGQAIGDTILNTIRAVDPGVELPVASAQIILDLLAKLVVTGLTAWSNASGTPITVESIQALLPNQTPLTAPDPAA